MNNNTRSNEEYIPAGQEVYSASDTYSETGNGAMSPFNDSFTVPAGGAVASCSLEVDDWGTLTISGPGGPFTISLTSAEDDPGPWAVTNSGARMTPSTSNRALTAFR